MPDPMRLRDAVRLSTADRATLGVVCAAVFSLADERRARVLRYEDLAKRLTERPLMFAQPQQWTGYVPPRTLQDQEPDILHSGAPWATAGRANSTGRTTGPTEMNLSAQRDALVQICAEAFERDVAAGREPKSDADVLGPLLASFGGAARAARAAAGPPRWAAEPEPEDDASQPAELWPDGSNGKASQ